MLSFEKLTICHQKPVNFSQCHWSRTRRRLCFVVFVWSCFCVVSGRSRLFWVFLANSALSRLFRVIPFFTNDNFKENFHWSTYYNWAWFYFLLQSGASYITRWCSFDEVQCKPSVIRKWDNCFLLKDNCKRSSYYTMKRLP